MRRLLLVLSAALLACGSRTPPVETAVQPAAQADAGADAAATCVSSRDCGAGQDCVGAEGCDSVWTCQPARPCTRDAVQYCSCEGETVIGSSRCPPRPYRHRGPCAGDADLSGSR